MLTSKRSIYKKARENGYIIEYGKRHYFRMMYKRRDGVPVFPIVYDRDGEPEYGYNIIDCSYNCLVWGCYNDVYDRLYDWKDVANFVEAL